MKVETQTNQYVVSTTVRNSSCITTDVAPKPPRDTWLVRVAPIAVQNSGLVLAPSGVAVANCQRWPFFFLLKVAMEHLSTRVQHTHVTDLLATARSSHSETATYCSAFNTRQPGDRGKNSISLNKVIFICVDQAGWDSRALPKLYSMTDNLEISAARKDRSVS